MLVAANVTIQFGAKPLFDNVSVKFGDGNRYGLIGANGSGKSTFMKILCGQLEPTAGNVSKDPHERIAYLRQDQFGFEDVRVLDVVLMGHEEMWKVMSAKDAIYADMEATEDDYMKAAELEGQFAEMDGYTAESRAGELLMAVGIPIEQHNGPMSQVALAGNCGCCCAKPCSPTPTFCCWTNQPTTSTSIPSAGWKKRSITAIPP